MAPHRIATRCERVLRISGPYAPLIGAIRDELEHFVTDELRLHLTIAEHDRYVLTSIDVDCEGGDEHRELLRKFVGEFKPEQIKHYLAREVIAGLRNASAIDLAQFAGLNASAREADANNADEEYAELLAELRSGSPQGDVASVSGHAGRPLDAVRRGGIRRRVASSDPATRAACRSRPDAARRTRLHTRCRGWLRRPPRRAHVGGSGPALCDRQGRGIGFVVDGTYASRRHCEIWFDRGAWWVVDTGSTNGIRVESRGAAARGGTRSGRAGAEEPHRASSWSVLLCSAAQVCRASRASIPRLSLRPPGAQIAIAAVDVTAGSHAGHADRAAAPRRKWTLPARMASGARRRARASALPFRVGRSRNQALVIDWAHADVSGRHFEIVALDDDGVSVVVLGDNGVVCRRRPPTGPGRSFGGRPGRR